MIITKKIAAVFMLLIIAATSMTGCAFQKSTQEPPEISVTIGDKEIQYLCEKNKWNGSVYDREDTFQTIMKSDSGIEVPFIEIVKTAIISFKSNPPDTFTVTDILIDEKGHQLYNDKVNNNIPIKLKDGKCSFKIDRNWASLLSSYYEENKKDIRGFRMIASWGQNECEYAFAIKTKA